MPATDDMPADGPDVAGVVVEFVSVLFRNERESAPDGDDVEVPSGVKAAVGWVTGPLVRGVVPFGAAVLGFTAPGETPLFPAGAVPLVGFGSVPFVELGVVPFVEFGVAPFVEFGVAPVVEFDPGVVVVPERFAEVPLPPVPVFVPDPVEVPVVPFDGVLLFCEFGVVVFGVVVQPVPCGPFDREIAPLFARAPPPAGPRGPGDVWPAASKCHAPKATASMDERIKEFGFMEWVSWVAYRFAAGPACGFIIPPC